MDRTSTLNAEIRSSASGIVVLRFFPVRTHIDLDQVAAAGTACPVMIPDAVELAHGLASAAMALKSLSENYTAHRSYSAVIDVRNVEVDMDSKVAEIPHAQSLVHTRENDG